MPFLVIRHADADAAAVVGEADNKSDAEALIKSDMESSVRPMARYTVAGGQVSRYTARLVESVDVSEET